MNDKPTSTAAAIARQPFTSFDIKLPSGIRYSFERRGTEYKILEGMPGKSRVYRRTVTIELTPNQQAYLKDVQVESEFQYPDHWQVAKDMFWHIAGKPAFW